MRRLFEKKREHEWGQKVSIDRVRVSISFRVIVTDKLRIRVKAED